MTQPRSGRAPRSKSRPAASGAPEGPNGPVQRRVQLLLGRVRILEKDGLPIPTATIRRALELARRTEGPKQAQALLDHISLLLTQTRRRWIPVRDHFRQASQLREAADRAGVDLARFDQRITEVRGWIGTSPLSERLFSEADARLLEAIGSLEAAMAEATARESSEETESNAMEPLPISDPTTTPIGPTGARAPVLSFPLRGGPRRTESMNRPCPGCGSSIDGSYCPRCRMLWED